MQINRSFQKDLRWSIQHKVNEKLYKAKKHQGPSKILTSKLNILKLELKKLLIWNLKRTEDEKNLKCTTVELNWKKTLKWFQCYSAKLKHIRREFSYSCQSSPTEGHIWKWQKNIFDIIFLKDLYLYTHICYESYKKKSIWCQSENFSVSTYYTTALMIRWPGEILSVQQN